VSSKACLVLFHTDTQPATGSRYPGDRFKMTAFVRSFVRPSINEYRRHKLIDFSQTRYEVHVIGYFHI
jgi:hypothetical protein